MTTEETPPPTREDTSTPVGISLRALFLVALIPSLVVLGALLYLVISRQADIRQECQRMLLTSLPQLMEQQRMAVNVERLRRLGSAVYISADPVTRRKARIEGQALTTDASFDSVPDSRPALDQAYADLQRMAQERDEQNALRLQLHETVARIESVHIQLHNAFMQLPQARALAQLTNFSAAFLELLNVQDVRNVTTGEENVEVIINKISSLEAQARGGGLPDSVLSNYRFLEQQSYQFLRVYKEYFAAEKNILDAWQDFDSALRSLDERITMSAAYGIETMLQNSISLAMGVERITWQGFMVLCATLIIGLFLIRNLVCVPMLWLVKTIGAIRDGQEPVHEPKIFIYELQRLASALLRLNFQWARVKAHSEQLENERHLLEGLSIKDGLTDMFNRRYFDIMLHNMWEEASREGSSVALLMMDIDHFKNYNDTLGHPKGDECLKLLAKSFDTRILRPSDKVCRYGGEEFALLLHCLTPEGPLRVAARIHDGVRQLALAHPASSVSDFVTLSIGVVVHTPREGDSAPMLIEWADHALYAAKKAGRNRTFLCRLRRDATGKWCEKLEEVGHGNDTVA